MTIRRSVWEWSLDYVGDPRTWSQRGERIVEFLKENGLTTQSRVLEIGCGNLSQGKPLIEFLAPGHFCGIEPNGWLVEAALDRFPALESQAPRFAWNTDFDATGFDTDFDIILAHSVLSHAAHWQLAQLLAATRNVVDEGALFLCSFRRGQVNSLAEEWTYPGVTQFRIETIQAAGTHAGWHVELVHEYRERLLEVAPNDGHDWLRMRAVARPAELNEFRLVEEERYNEEQRKHDADERARRMAHETAEADAGLL